MRGMVDENAQISLDGQVGVVTGGGRGIGREIALHLARAGMKVAVTARTESELEEVVETITSRGGTAMARVMDVLDGNSVEQAFAAVVDQLGPVDLLVNNAGIIGKEGQPWQVDLEDWWRVMEVNVKGAMRCCQAVLPSMVLRGKGRIINMGSNAAFIEIPVTFPIESAYPVSKAALARLGEVLATYTKEHGIPVFTISPGMVRTEMTKVFNEGENKIPDDAWTPVEKAAELCLFLAGGRADVLTGRYIHARTDDVREMVRRADEIKGRGLHRMNFPAL